LKTFRWYDYFFIAILFAGSFWFQSHVYFNWDASWHLEAAKRIVHGGASYSKNLFDDNLPMVFWYFIPAVLLHQFTGIFIIRICIAYILLSVLISFLLCHVCLKEIYAQSKWWEFQVIRYVLLISLLFFPGQEFGQRDMMVVTFVLPYIILIAARLKTNFNLTLRNAYFRAFLGLLAAIGIAMNPFYGLIIVVLEIQMWLSAKKILLWRPEIITFIIAYVIYLLAIGLVYPDYYTQIIPSYLAFSYVYNVPIRILLNTSFFENTLFSAFIYFLIRSSNMNRDWLRTLLICVIAAYVVFFVNGKLWPSHTIFLVVFTNLFFAAVACHIFACHERKIRNYGMGVLSLFLLFSSVTLACAMNVTYYRFSNNKQTKFARLVSFFNHQPPHSSLFLLSTRSFPTFSMIDYTTLHYLSPWPDCWSIRAFLTNKNQMNILTRWKKTRIEAYKKIFTPQIASIFAVKKPTYVMVDVGKNQGGVKGFNYIHYLSQNLLFRQQWKHYVLVKIISHYDIYAYKAMPAQMES